jgi:hypothetical protein
MGRVGSNREGDAMTRSSVDQSCACPCGQSTFRVRGVPVSRFLCHCTICQSVYKQAFADVTTFWAGAVLLPEDNPVRFRRYRPPPALRRGTCPSCNAPVVGFLRLAPFLQLAFVPSRNFADVAALPPPGAHIFYHRRARDMPDSLPKISGYWPSELAVTRAVMGSLFHGADGE